MVAPYPGALIHKAVLFTRNPRRAQIQRISLGYRVHIETLAGRDHNTAAIRIPLDRQDLIPRRVMRQIIQMIPFLMKDTPLLPCVEILTKQAPDRIRCQRIVDQLRPWRTGHRKHADQQRIIATSATGSISPEIVSPGHHAIPRASLPLPPFHGLLMPRDHLGGKGTLDFDRLRPIAGHIQPPSGNVSVIHGCKEPLHPVRSAGIRQRPFRR
ncbi:MAG: hypothetical protein BWY82_02551 [Verrucomicrobia bacterium ADurb.Bin474]|nr:MAG: hypothetical protein BWY82_02551 [Verrucomicrobia bacterium ADurb.Bin474]